PRPVSTEIESVMPKRFHLRGTHRFFTVLRHVVVRRSPLRSMNNVTSATLPTDFAFLDVQA
ncbi:MAG TPA: hypothetical protein PLI53_01885, partial [Geobacteraceae bacterium]|nr:hypothetical protein [Geobacteraceae bacterium]